MRAALVCVVLALSACIPLACQVGTPEPRLCDEYAADADQPECSCDTDSDCAARCGGNGDPEPVD